MSDDLFTGVDDQDVSAAGEQGIDETQEQDTEEQEESLFDFGDYTGADDDAAAGQDAGNQAVIVQDDDPVEKAFAKRLAAEREKIRRELEEQYQQQQPQQGGYLGQQQSYPQGYQQIQQSGPPPLPQEQLENLADQLGVTTEAAYAMYHQQWLIEQQNQAIQQQRQETLRLADERAKIAAKNRAEAQRKKNPNLPEFDESKLTKLRTEYQKRTGLTLPWDDVYQLHVANEAMSGNLSRAVEQAAIANITSRNKTNIQAGRGGTAKKPSIEDLPKEQFEKLVEQAKQGKFKRS
jgi:hypothetical protein